MRFLFPVFAGDRLSSTKPPPCSICFGPPPTLRSLSPSLSLSLGFSLAILILNLVSAQAIWSSTLRRGGISCKLLGDLL
ncbi:hypothetical protein L1987_54947 [Smallanthus sonchifolius]|uniref:Uncharacterized protein n=1 Tax=Smallanthus sonchifolius TaxID=185202 RepID=A0ACB9E8M1_9ASTR|nr:hypothetical protein L1987_54947 [Smallanthus sonchifolius]